MVESGRFWRQKKKKEKKKKCAKNTNIFAKFFGENIFKIITAVPG
jgi:uncharacterized membrane protein